MKTEIKNTDGVVIYTHVAKFSSDVVALNEAAVQNISLYKADLSGMDLEYAMLSGADLSYANLNKTILTDALLCNTNLSFATLNNANLRGASLTGANLSGATLLDANLTNAFCSSANLTDADFSGATLYKTLFRNSNLKDIKLDTIRKDVFKILDGAPNEVAKLIQVIKGGGIHGAVYSGVCACLVGSIANLRNVAVSTMLKDAYRPAERFVLSIERNMIPSSHQQSKILLDFCNKWSMQNA